jgi:hypothetical protein
VKRKRKRKKERKESICRGIRFEQPMKNRKILEFFDETDYRKNITKREENFERPSAR